MAKRAAEAQELCGYVLALYGEWCFVSELGVLSGDAAAIPSLLTAVAKEATNRSIQSVQLSLPHESHIDEALNLLLGQTLQQFTIEGSMMARPIAQDFGWQQLESMFTAPGAVSWELDHF